MSGLPVAFLAAVASSSLLSGCCGDCACPAPDDAEDSATDGSSGAAGSSGAGGSGGTGGSGGSGGVGGTGGSAGGEGGEGGAGGGTCDPAASPEDDACVVDEQYAVFVSPTGSATGDGSRAAPFDSLGAAFTEAAASGKLWYCKFR